MRNQCSREDARRITAPRNQALAASTPTRRAEHRRGSLGRWVQLFWVRQVARTLFTDVLDTRGNINLGPPAEGVSHSVYFYHFYVDPRHYSVSLLYRAAGHQLLPFSRITLPAVHTRYLALLLALGSASHIHSNSNGIAYGEAVRFFCQPARVAVLAPGGRRNRAP